PTEVYPHGSVFLHFHSDKKKSASKDPKDNTAEISEVHGRIENLDNVWFWTDTRDKIEDRVLGSDTDKWPSIPDVDAGRYAAPQEPRAADLKRFWGTPAIPRGAA